MIVDPTVIQLKNSLQSHCIIKINPDYIKLCWNRPQLFALLKQLLKSSSRRYIWVSGKYILGFILFLNVNGGGKLSVLPRVLGGSWKPCDSLDSKIFLIPEMKEKKTLRFSVSVFYRKDIRRKSKSVEYSSCQQKEVEVTAKKHSGIFCGGLFVLVFWAGSCQPVRRDC